MSTKTPRIRWVIFDLDGVILTLIVPLKSKLAFVWDMLKFGINPFRALRVIKENFGSWPLLIKALQDLLKTRGVNLDEYEIVHKWLKVFNGGSKPELIKNAYEVIHAIKESGVSVGLITNRTPKTYKRLCENAEIFKFLSTAFDFIQIYGSNQSLPKWLKNTDIDVSKFAKPDARSFKELCQIYKINPKEVIYIGDTKIDYDFAKNSGIEFVGVTAGIIKINDWLNFGLGKDYIIKSVKNLPNWLKNHQLI